MYDLPSEDPEEPGLPDQYHSWQPRLFEDTFQPPDVSPDEVFIGSDINLYYDVRHTLWYKRPDWFAVLGVPKFYGPNDELRLSYVTWQEGVTPTVVVEFVSPGTEKEDYGQTLRDVNKPPTKWEVYERILRVPYYVIFNRYTRDLQAFQIVASRYQPLAVQDERVWLPQIQLGIGLWQGSYQGNSGQWLRWYRDSGEWITSPEEALGQERQRSEQAHQRAERLAARLRELGLDPED